MKWSSYELREYFDAGGLGNPLGDEGFDLMGDYICLNGKELKITAISKDSLDPNGDPRYHVRLTIVDEKGNNFSEGFYVRTADELVDSCSDMIKRYEDYRS